MANITLGQILHTNTNEPLGTTGGALHVQLNGSKTEITALTNTPLGAGANYTTAWKDGTDGRLIGISVRADTIVTVVLQRADDESGGNSSGSSRNYAVTLLPNSDGGYLPPISVDGWYKIQVINPTSAAQTQLKVNEINTWGNTTPKAVRVHLAYNAEIRTADYQSPFNNSALKVADMGFFGNGTHPIFIKNGLDQEIAVSITYAGDDNILANVGNFTLAAGATTLKTNQDFAGLDIPTRRIYLGIKASEAPTSGAVNAFTIAMMGGH